MLKVNTVHAEQWLMINTNAKGSSQDKVKIDIKQN